MKVCEVCGTSEGNIYGKNGKFKMDLCSKHYTQRISGEISGLECSICGETNGRIVNTPNKFGKILCARHYTQMHKYGEILDKTIYDENKILYSDGYAEIVIRNIKNADIASAIIDLDDIDIVSSIKWHYSKTDGYVYGYVSGKQIAIHRLVTNAPDGHDVDHINHNKLDNRKSNLRVVTHAQNLANRGLLTSNTSGHTGVYWNKDRSKWQVQIRVNGKNKCMGRYDKLEDAVIARKIATQKYHGEFAYKEVLA